jgi:hypothetical protein
MIDWEREQTMRLRDIDRVLPGKPVSLATKFRWATKGARGVVLKTFLLGGTRMTSVEAVRRFVAEVSKMGAQEMASPPVARGKSTASKRRDAVNQELQNRGF